MVHVLLYLPNILDYLRLGMLVLGLSLYEKEPVWFIGLYIGSAALDGVDGMAARALDQSKS